MKMPVSTTNKIRSLRIAIGVGVIFLFIVANLKVGAQIDGEDVGQTKPPPISTPTVPYLQDDLDNVAAAVFREIAQRGNNEFVFTAYSTQLDRVEISADKKYAFAWMALLDVKSGETIPSEPGLALLQYDGVEWQVALPSDTIWETWLTDAPLDLISAGEKEFWVDLNTSYADALPLAPISGYRLPWEAGRTVYLSGSVAHDEYIPSGNSHYAFDFYIPGVMFNLFASRAGTVYLYHDSQPNGDVSDPGNYLVLRDTTTVPVTYQLYLHLAQSSIPLGLRSIGAPVARGQFIGISDDTGASTGHHLHYQVHTNPSSYWGKSVDITFDDVTVNGGRPRVEKDKPYCSWAGDVCNTFQLAYVSGNIKSDPNPPKGNFVGLTNGDLINSPTFVISGWAEDAESGLRSIQIVAAYNNAMHNLGPVFTSSPFSYTLDVCQSGIPDGPISLGLRIMDNQSNIAYLPGLVTLTKNIRCEPPPSTCTAGPNQVALFAQPDYHGACVVLNSGNYLANLFGSVGDNNLESIKLGENVMATLFVDPSYQGRAETLLTNNSNLGDNLVNNNSVSSLMVVPKTQTPGIPQPVWPAPGSTYTPGNSLSFYLRNAGGATEFQFQILNLSDSSILLISPWVKVPYWTLGDDLILLTPGNYSWQVRGRNPAATSSWSAANNLTVSQPGSVLPPQAGLPFQDDMEIDRGWTTTGLWHREAGTSPIPANSGNYYMWFGETNNGDERYFTAKQGDLTSPVFTLPAGSSNYLRFWYAYQTESTMSYWDQRWVQISVDDGPFVNLLQLSGETMNSTGYAAWLPSPVIDLSNYAGSAIRIRFYFDTIEPSGNKPDNDFEGWFIDDVSITTQPPPTCLNLNEPNETPNDATAIEYLPSTVIAGEICPYGDLDYYKFWGVERNLVAANTDAKNSGSKLDTVLTLYDSDGQSVLAENDDEDNTGGILDSLLVYRIPRTGWYYLRVRSWDYPAGGANYVYTLRLLSDEIPPAIDLLVSDEAAFGSNPLVIQAHVVEQQSAVDRVRFFWHDSDWDDPAWDAIGDGVQNGDIWQVTFTPSGRLEGIGGAFYAIAYDLAGNKGMDGAWNQKLDLSPPVTSILKLSPTQTSNLIHVQWQGQDTISGLSGYDIEVSVDGGGWSPIGGRYFYPQTSTNYLVEPGHLYAYRIRGIDQAGNVEPYPSVEDTVTYVPVSSQLCDIVDEFETDNTWDQAHLILLDELVRRHNFCNPAASDFSGDQDWVRFQVPANQRVSVMASPDSSSPAYLTLVLYRKTGNNLIEITRVESSGYGQPVWLTWTSAENQEYYLQSSSVNPHLIGKGAGYWLQVYPGPPRILFLPIVWR